MERPINELTTDRTVRIVIIAVLALLGLFLLLKSADALENFGHPVGSTQNTITVSGTGKSSVAPDIAHISFSVQENASTVAAAQDSATKRTNASLAALKKLGIADADVKTTGYNVYPQYEQQPCLNGACPQPSAPKIASYQVSQTVEVKVRDTAKAGDVLQALGTLGVQNISGPDFGVDDPSKTQEEARANAIKDAKEKAEVLARQLGVHLGKVASFNESTGGTYPMYQALGKSAAMDSVQATPPTLPTGTNDTTVNVTITYEIR